MSPYFPFYLNSALCFRALPRNLQPLFLACSDYCHRFSLHVQTIAGPMCLSKSGVQLERLSWRSKAVGTGSKIHHVTTGHGVAYSYAHTEQDPRSVPGMA
eukprot:1824492-Rhodomonas_salina.2